jgi:hypothetical protein
MVPAPPSQKEHEMFYVYGDYGYLSEELLEEFSQLAEALRWVSEYIRGGDFGGYDVIEVASFADDGEYITHTTFRKD